MRSNDQWRLRGGSFRRRAGLAVAAALAVPLLQACGSGGSGGNTLTWWQNPDQSGSSTQILNYCNQQANGRYVLRAEVLPNLADAQREQLVRRLAAKDQTMNLMYMDVIWAPEFAEAGWIIPFEEEAAQRVSEDVLKGPLAASTWKDRVYAAPWSSNSQLLWYRKSLAQQAGIDMAKPNLTWDEIIDASARVPAGSRFVEVQANRYEGYMVLINALINSAGGGILDNPEAGSKAVPTVDSPAGRRAAEIIRKLANSPAADIGLSSSTEETGRAAFQNGTAWAMANWPYVYAVGRANAEKDPAFKRILDDYGWTRYPRVDANTPSKPPLGGAMIGVGAYTPAGKRDAAFEAAACITSKEMQTLRMKLLGEPAVKSSVYEDPEIRSQYPYADLVRDSINDAAPRPLTPYFNDLTIAIQRTFHPPGSVNPSTTPKKADALIKQALSGRVLL